MPPPVGKYSDLCPGKYSGRAFWGYLPPQKIFLGQSFRVLGYWLSVGARGFRIISHLCAARGARCPCAARIWVARSAVALSRTARGAKLRRSFRVTVFPSRRSNQSSNRRAVSLGCCSVFFLTGVGRPRSSRSKIVIAAIRRSVVRCDQLRFVSGYWAEPPYRLLQRRPGLVLDLWLAHPRPCRCG